MSGTVLTHIHMHMHIHRCYKGIKRLMETIKKRCREVKYVETVLGRRRYLPDIGSSDRQLKSRAERQVR